MNSPFDAPPEASKVNATHSPFNLQSGASVAPTAVVGSPFGSPPATPAGAPPVNSPFDSPINPHSEAPASVEVDGSSLPPHEPVSDLGGRRDEAAAEQPSHKDATRKEAEFTSENDARGRELFGGSYRPQLAADASPAFSGEGWSPWYLVRDKTNSHLAAVDIAYGYGGNTDKGKTGDQPVQWVLRNRSKKILAVEYELNIRCAERCTSGWYNFRAVVPAGKSVHGGERELWQIQGARVLKVQPK